MAREFQYSSEARCELLYLVTLLYNWLRIFTYKLVTYNYEPATSPVCKMPYFLHGSCRVSTVCSGIRGSYKLALVLLDHIELGFGLVFGRNVAS